MAVTDLPVTAVPPLLQLLFKITVVFFVFWQLLNPVDPDKLLQFSLHSAGFFVNPFFTSFR